MYGNVAHLRIMNGPAGSILPFLGIVVIAIGMVLWVWVGFHPQVTELRRLGEQVAAEKWMVANVASDARVTADSSVTSDLVRAGFTRRPPVAYIQIDIGGLPQGGSWRDFDYLVSTRSTRFESAILPPLEQALRSSIAVAIFGDGPDRVEVRQILPRGIDGVDVRRSADAQARRRAEAALLHNRRVQVDLAAVGVLEAGGLDLRAATVLAFMADRELLRVDAIDSDPAETAAGLPARTVEISVTQPTLVADTVRGLPTDYRPQLVRTLGPTRSQLVWPIAVAPVVPVT